MYLILTAPMFEILLDRFAQCLKVYRVRNNIYLERYPTFRFQDEIK